ncbi:MAG: cupin domain-containing protein [Alphaproteobacteria bacterium]
MAIPPGYIGGKHLHTGPVFVYVLEGVLTVETENGTETFGAGDLYPEPMGVTMKGRNLSASDDLEILVFQVGDPGKPMMVKVE